MLRAVRTTAGIGEKVCMQSKEGEACAMASAILFLEIYPHGSYLGPKVHPQRTQGCLSQYPGWKRLGQVSLGAWMGERQQMHALGDYLYQWAQ